MKANEQKVQTCSRVAHTIANETRSDETYTDETYPDKTRTYQAYVLRCWAEPTPEAVTWRFSLEAIPSSERIGFAELADLHNFLSTQTEPQYTKRLIWGS